MDSTRSSIAVAWSVWQALFLREAVARLSVGRAAWLWILLEPIAHTVMLMVMLGFIFHRIISGIDGAMFVITGLLGFFIFKNTALNAMDAINANATLFTYRQVRPVDTVLVRSFVEGLLLTICSLILLAGAAMCNFEVIPFDPLAVLLAFGLLWMGGVGLGLVLSAAGTLIPEIGKLARLLFRPLYFLSGVQIPAMSIPHPYRDWLMYNPIVHGVESLRVGYFRTFHAPADTSMSYLFMFGGVSIFLGLALHVRFAQKLRSK